MAEPSRFVRPVNQAHVDSQFCESAECAFPRTPVEPHPTSPRWRPWRPSRAEQTSTVPACIPARVSRAFLAGAKLQKLTLAAVVHVGSTLAGLAVPLVAHLHSAFQPSNGDGTRLQNFVGQPNQIRDATCCSCFHALFIPDTS